MCRFLLKLGISPVCPIAAAMLQTVAFSANSTLAQELKPVADGTLGAESSVVTPTNPQTDQIDGGAVRGANLFHSFSQFNIGEGREAYFANPSGIENILSRVTGSDASKIFGKLGVLGNANLFLINPNGIIFGKNASLDVRGSFVASTASSLKFADGTEFTALAAQNTPLLTVSVPLGLQFNGTNPGSIQNQSQAIDSNRKTVGLQVQQGKTLAFVGGNVALEGGYLTAPNGRIELGSVAAEGLVSLTPTGKGFSLGYDAVQNLGGIQLSQQAAVDVSGASGGDIQVVGKRITLTNGSQIGASTLGAESGGNLVVNASELLEVIGRSANGRFPSALGVQAASSATGNAGNLTINTGRLLIQDGAQVNTSTFGGGNGGNLTVKADKVQLIGISANGQTPSGLFANTESSATGNAGNLTINTGELLIQDGAQVSTSTFGGGNGGNLTVKADKVQLIGISANGKTPSGLFANTESSATGNAGNSTINTGELLIQDGAQVSTSTFGGGKGGNLTVTANKVQLIGIGISANGLFPSGLGTVAYLGATGDAGDLRINTGELLIQDGAQVSAATYGKGKGGTLTVTANKVQLIGISANGSASSGLIAGTQGTGKAGDLSITTQQLLISNGALITVSSRGEGVAGDLGITANSVRLDNGEITAQTRSGNGGNLKLNVADLLLLRRDSEISTTAGTAQQPGDGGNITINAPNGFIVAVPSENSNITANAYTGTGGRVDINAFGIYGIQPRQNPTSLSDITASSEFGVNGTVELNTPEIDLNSALINLPSVPVETKLAQGCNSPNYAQSSFIITGRGGLPPNPKDILTPDAVQVDWVTLNPELDKNSSTNISTNPNTTTPAPIVEATGWVFGPKGEVIFTAQVPTQHQNSWQTPSKCHEK